LFNLYAFLDVQVLDIRYRYKIAIKGSTGSDCVVIALHQHLPGGTEKLQLKNNQGRICVPGWGLDPCTFRVNVTHALQLHVTCIVNTATVKLRNF